SCTCLSNCAAVMSLPFTRATTLAEAEESDPHEAATSTPASRADKMRGFITEHSIVIRNNGHSNTTPESAGERVLYSVLCHCCLIREIAFMARCEICNKGPIYGNKVSHAHNLTRRRWNPNLQRVRVLDGKTHKSMRVCTRCIRSGRVTKA